MSILPILGKTAMLFPAPPNNTMYEDKLGVLFKWGRFSVGISDKIWVCQRVQRATTETNP